MNIILLTDAEAHSPGADHLLDALDPGELHGVSVHDGAVALSFGAARPSEVRDESPPEQERRPLLLTH